MAFFKKLKDRLFKSSSKIDEGLEAIVEDGGEEDMVPEPVEPPQTLSPAPAPEPVAREAGPEFMVNPLSDRFPDTEPGALTSSVAEDAPETTRDEAPPVERVVVHETPVTESPAEPQPTEPEPRVETFERPDQTPPAPLLDVPQSGDAPETETTPEAAPTQAPVAPAPDPTAVAPPQPEPPQSLDLSEPVAHAPAERTGFFGRLMGRGGAKTVVRRTLDDDMLEQLEELLITADMGVDTALRVVANMAEGRMGSRLSVEEIKRLLAGEVAQIMEPVARPLPLYPKKPQVVLVVGVNGSGKTTTIGKLASQFRAAGKKVVIAAGDTFRAAAVEQLQVWGERAGVPVLTAPEGSDPASLAFDAIGRAQAEGADLLMIDTAGRLQNRTDLMEELAKIVRVIRKKDPDAPHNTLLVLDATTGQNAVNQVKVFRDLSDVSGLVMTKLDGTAKGGVLVALADQFGLPIHAIGVGEQIHDLDAFDPEDFANALMGLDAA
ncbi:MAG: signal recognition particle-docking protein FtsY [Pseudomonadota bacterium]